MPILNPELAYREYLPPPDGGEAKEVGASSSEQMAIADRATHRTPLEGELLLAIRLSRCVWGTFKLPL